MFHKTTSAFITMAIALSCAELAVGQTAYFPIMQDRPMEYPIRYAVCSEGKEPPIVDGKLDDVCWRNVGQLGDFQLTDAAADKGRWTKTPGRPARNQTRVKVLQADGTLYLGFECLEPEMDKIRAEAVYHDEERICFDDRIEVFLDPQHDHQNVFQFVVNARGADVGAAAGAPRTLRDEPYSWTDRVEHRVVRPRTPAGGPLDGRDGHFHREAAATAGPTRRYHRL